MRYQISLFLIFSPGLFLISSCSSGNSEVSDVQENEIKQTDNARALELLESKCFVCHSNKIPKDNLLAPPMIAVKEGYKSVTENQKEFVERFVKFVSDPSRKKAVLKDAVEQYGLMAYEGTKKEDLERIAHYIYSEEIAKPEWWDNSEQSTEKTKTPASIGMHYALSTKKALGKQLMKAIEKGGPAYAVEFCNTRAIPITDSVSTHFNATIDRVSDQTRNPNNKANKEELSIIDQYKTMLASNEDLKPITKDEENGTRFYFPIKTNAMCLKCHGEPKSDINASTLAKINEIYPNDQAKGYEANQIRGIWSILFKNTEE